MSRAALAGGVGVGAGAVSPFSRFFGGRFFFYYFFIELGLEIRGMETSLSVFYSFLTRI